MEWLTDPTIWLGLFTLIVLEIVLGIDNLIFIAILSEKLPPDQSNRARQIGLGLALFMRLGLLASLSWMIGLTAPLFTVLSVEISWRDVILILGGAFLLIKATIEIHDRLETAPHEHGGRPTAHAAFWPIVAQIVVLDAVFSLDSVITAVGMVDDLYVMMVAVVVAVIVMVFAAKPLSAFINGHPSLIILCLGFLLMVGFVLVLDGVGYHVPKGYLYAAIGFSVLIEAFNQLGLRNRRKHVASIPRRQRTADLVLRLLAGVPVETPVAGEEAGTLAAKDGQEVFAHAEKEMVRGVLTLADRPVKAIMTPRTQIDWIDAVAAQDAVLAVVRRSPHRQFVVGRGSLDDVVGIARKDSILGLFLEDQPFDITRAIQQPLVVPENASVLETLELFKRTPIEMALVVDEYGTLMGVVTRTDLLEAVAGELPDAGDEAPPDKPLSDGSLLLDGALSIHETQQRLRLDKLPDGESHTLAGFLISLFQRIPANGERIDWGGWRFEVAERHGWRIHKVRARRVGSEG